jgi:hypothetical protein
MMDWYLDKPFEAFVFRVKGIEICGIFSTDHIIRDRLNKSYMFIDSNKNTDKMM